MAKLDTSHLVLKQVLVKGKLQHRWVNPNTDEEHAPHGSRIKFEHHGKEMSGIVGSVISTGEYAVKGDNGINYNKHRHQFEPLKEEFKREEGFILGEHKLSIKQGSNGKFKYSEGKIPIELTKTIIKDGFEQRVSLEFDTKEKAQSTLDKFNQYQKEQLAEAEKLNKETTTTERVTNGFKSMATGYPVIDTVLNKAIPHLEKIVETYKERAEKEGRVFTAREQTYIELELVKDLVNALGNYIKKTDTIENLDFKQSKAVVAISARIMRDGKPNYFSTQMIYAGGYNIQVLHFRYIVDTKLPHMYNAPVKAIEAKIKHMRAEDKIKADINQQEGYIKQYTNKAKELETKTKEQFFEEEEQRHIKTYGGTMTWDRLAGDAPARKNYTENEWNQRWIDEKERNWIYHQNQIKSNLQYAKEATKKKTKLEEKLVAHLKEEAKYENPNEGDRKITRAKGAYVQRPIELFEFKDGNWKRQRGTSHKNIKAGGFNPYNDEEVWKYHEKNPLSN